ncbi:DUF4190 domain-containing protein [Microbacterium capsulatum]|uniref:DUF4190 domain-containing protein n=1 Tax=Microbacterium capsulatum TaxID=3041921 RepID=A0ABU0XDY5_9MICO|nr:DUF4190 domain-containing protein [Microbacterium sp. ASV81]MDQ4213338.1 DUF4190 domain-containing protein [Microbacterium sp. ASV81]
MSNDQGGYPQQPGQEPPADPGVPGPPQQPAYPGAAPAPQQPAYPVYPAPAQPAAPPQPAPPQGAPAYPGATQPSAPTYPAPAYPAPAYPGAAPQAPVYPGAGAPGAPVYGQQYGQQYGQPYGQPYAVPKKSNGLAVASMICGIASAVFCWAYLILPLLLGIPAVIMGHISLKRIKNDPQLGGRPLAITGLITGYAGIGLGVIVGAFIIVAIFYAVSLSNTYGY